MKKVLFGVGIVALGGIVYFGLNGDTTKTTPGVEGTIGAAKRYQAEQITTDDVELDDASINDVVQTEVFHELVTNPDFRKLVTSPEFQKLAASDAWKGFIADPEVQKSYAALETGRSSNHTGNIQVALADGSVRKLVTESPEFQRLVQKDGFDRFISESAVQAKLATADGARHLLMAKGTINDAELARLVASNAVYARIFEDADFQKLLAENADGLAKLTANAEFARFASRPTVMKILANADFNKLLSESPDAARTLFSPEVGRLVSQSDSFRNAFVGADYGKLISRPEFQKLVANADAERRR